MCYPSDMRNFIVFVLCLFLSATAWADIPIRVIDGDTFARGEHRYRIWGIDAPESGAVCPDGYPAGREATKLLTALLSNDHVDCSDLGRDRYGRVVTQCLWQGRDLAGMMVSEGLAWDWPRYSKGEYQREQAVASSGGRGIWSHGCVR
jgi:endonuclease YncB( thermonuclease family)